MDQRDILDLINRFLSGENNSIAAAQEIEVAIDDALPDDEYFQDTVSMLAQYRPGGGDLLFDEAEMGKRLEEIAESLSRRE